MSQRQLFNSEQGLFFFKGAWRYGIPFAKMTGRGHVPCQKHDIWLYPVSKSQLLDPPKTSAIPSHLPLIPWFLIPNLIPESKAILPNHYVIQPMKSLYQSSQSVKKDLLHDLI